MAKRNSRTSVPAERTAQRTSWQILLIREHEEQTLLHLPVTQYPVKFLFRLIDPFPVLTIDDENQALGAGVVVSPQWTDFVLASDIPDIELNILIGNGLDIETDYRQISRRHYTGKWLAPVGMVVTDWFSLSLYRIAGQKLSTLLNGMHEIHQLTCLSCSIEPKHQ